MWIFLSDAFLSVVADKADPRGDRLLVRARRRGHIERHFPEADVFQVAGSDYRHRAWVPRRQVAEAMTSQVEAITYPNFKNSIADPEYHEAALRAWGVMHGFQELSTDA